MTAIEDKTDIQQIAGEMLRVASQLVEEFQASPSPNLQDQARALASIKYTRERLQRVAETGLPEDGDKVATILTISDLEINPGANLLPSSERWPLKMATMIGFVDSQEVVGIQATLFHPERPLMAVLKLGWQGERAPQFVWDELSIRSTVCFV